MLGDLENESSSREVDDLKSVENGGKVLFGGQGRQGQEGKKVAAVRKKKAVSPCVSFQREKMVVDV